ncbi:MAG: polysaccharide biosynthesis tyrosine autokinase [Flavobacterium sp.]
MLNPKDFSFTESHNNFDFKAFLIKITSYWKWFLLSLTVAFTIAYQINVRKEKIYQMDTTISVKEENNPFFTSNTSLVFNWGGTSDKIQTLMFTLKSRTHNELVVDKLQFYIDYLKQSEYNLVDAYGEVPFFVVIDKKKGQLKGTNIKIKFISENEYEISIPFENESVSLVHYADNSNSNTAVAKGTFVKRFKVGQQVALPFLNWKLEINDNPGFYKGKEFFVRFKDFDGTVAGYQGINVDADAKGASILRLSLQGTNKAKMVKYLNTTVEVLKGNQLAMKNQFATNTIAFIDSTLVSMESQLKVNSDELASFKRQKNITGTDEGNLLSARLLEYDIKKDEISRKQAYCSSLKNYLKNSVDFSKLPAPSVAGIDDPNIMVNVSKLIALSTQRAEMRYAVKSEKIFRDFDNQMEAIKNILLENISSLQSSLNYDMSLIVEKINASENIIKKLPEDQQKLLKIKRKFDLNDNMYNIFLAKKSEADIVRAANLSDIHFIDKAKDIGGGLIGPKTGVNYMMALFLGSFLPFIFVVGIFLINSSVQNSEDIAGLTPLPVLGIIGKKQNESNLSVFESPKSALSESFRALRSSLQFLYKKQQLEGAKTLMITSTISGEGKTFCSINIATVFALSEKKTIILGLDLRKPKIFDDFNITNNMGVVNCLIGQNTLEEVIQQTHIPYLDVIPSGLIPPNPSELIMNESMKVMLDELKTKYDYIILDTPPIGLVSDAMSLAPFSDVVLYVVRQNYTKKEMVKMLNYRIKSGELSNVSIVLNAFENKAKFGYNYNYGYGYGYGYGSSGNGYYEQEKKQSKFQKIIKSLKVKLTKEI